MFRPTRVLIPVDGSEHASLALDWALMATDGVAGAELLLCYVLTTPTAPLGPEPMLYDLSGAEQVTAMRLLESAKRRVPGTVGCATMICEGRAGVEIARAAATHRADLIVMATHGRRGVSRMLHSNVAEEVVRVATCPVLVLHLTKSTLAALRESRDKRAPANGGAPAKG